MKKIIIISIVLFLIVNYISAQDTLYVYKAGQVVTKKAVNDLDSLSFIYTPPATGTVNDIDGNTYHWIKIGTQTWMTENLKTTKFRTGESITNISDAALWGTATFAAFCDYNNDPINSAKYGRLYNWYAVNDARKIVLHGWHVPIDLEWTTLQNYLIANGGNYDGTISGNKIGKSLAATTDWASNAVAGTIGNNPSLNNSSGFNGLSGGHRLADGTFGSLGSNIGCWWSSTQFDINSAWMRYLYCTYNSLENSNNNNLFGLSVRCMKDMLPVLNITILSSYSSTTASLGGSISYSGGVDILSKGVCWSTYSNPTINDTKNINGTGLDAFTGSITGLTPGTTYYARSFATNSVGTAYGDQISFTTWTIPTLTTSSISSITSSSSFSGGNIMSNGGADISSKGVCWSVSTNPTINDSKTYDGTGISAFTSTISGLAAGTTYYIRSYATNSVGTAYGMQLSFTTSITIPTLTTSLISSITDSSASSGGNIISNGGSDITARGVCWSTSSKPTINESKTTNGIGIGTYASIMSGLTAGTTYYIRSYATNSAGTAYGEQFTFTTAMTIPLITTISISSITDSTAVSGGNITSNGGAVISAKGICWSTSSNPTINDNKINDGTGNLIFSGLITGLTYATTYYVRAYATNSIGTGYGVQISFLTSDILKRSVNDLDGNIYHFVKIGTQW